MNRESNHSYGSAASRLGRAFFIALVVAGVLTPLYFAVDAQQQGAVKPETKEQQPADLQKSLEEERLNILKSDIRKEIERYNSLKQEVEDALKQLDLKKKDSLERLAKIFEAMPAEEAARRLEKLDEDSSVALLTTLKPRTAGKILAQVEPALAAKLSGKILSRGKLNQEKSSR